MAFVMICGAGIGLVSALPAVQGGSALGAVASWLHVFAALCALVFIIVEF
jgi:hypothetical protein